MKNMPSRGGEKRLAKALTHVINIVLERRDNRPPRNCLFLGGRRVNFIIRGNVTICGEKSKVLNKKEPTRIPKDIHLCDDGLPSTKMVSTISLSR